MSKKMGYALTIGIIIIMISLNLINDPDRQPHENSLSKRSYISKEIPRFLNTKQQLLSEIVAMAKSGRVPQAAFVAGKTKLQEVLDQWDEIEQPVSTTEESYLENLENHITVGYQDNYLFDVRSYDPRLNQIHLSDIKAMYGEADEIRYYKDNTYDQVILVYNVNDTHILKWVLPKPSNEEPNPKVHHISVSTDVTKSDNISSIIASMSIEEKIGQLVIAGMEGNSFNTETKKLIEAFHVGGVIFYEDSLTSPEQSMELLNQFKTANVSNPLPLFLTIDQEGGRVSKLPGQLFELPINKDIGKLNDPQLSYKVGELLGKQVKAFGFNVNYAPVLDVNSNPHNPIIGDRAFSDNPEIVSKLGIETMKGMQAQDVISVIKHFPGHGDTSLDSHLELPQVNKSLDELNQIELVPFKQAIVNGADAVMVAHILFPKLDSTYPASISSEIITNQLRGNLGFDGIVITDDLTMKGITNTFEIGQAAVKSIQAGSDLVMVAHDYQNVAKVINALKIAVNNGDITERRLDESLSRIIKMKQKYNLSREQIKGVDISKLNQSSDTLLKRYEFK